MDRRRSNRQPHWLDRMFKPKSVALVGASARPGSIGHNMLTLLAKSGYRGAIYPINPRYETLADLPCYPTLAELPGVPDLLVFGIGGLALERAFAEAIALGVGGAVIFANNYLPDDVTPPLLERLRQKARQANFPVCGGNGMGFYNYDESLIVSFDSPPPRPAGHITLIAHSGSVMTYLANNDARYTYNLVVSPGQEINGTAADYMDYALEQPSTRVIALFIEAVRDVISFIAALNKARERAIPVVVTKVGRTEKSARFAASHSGALAGSDVAFQAVCDHYGAIRVRNIDELIATALILAQGRRPSPGGLASLLDSGGLREQFIDLADELGVPFAQISETTRTALAATLEFGLEPDNPVDAMGSFTADIKNNYSRCLQALVADPDTALLTLEFEFRDNFCHYPELLELAEAMPTYTEKPVLIINSSDTVSNGQKAARFSQAGIPVINGAEIALRAIRNVLWYRDYQLANHPQPSAPVPPVITTWQTYLAQNPIIDEASGLQLLSDFGLPAMPFRIAHNLEETLSAAAKLGYPVVMKTAVPEIQHKSDVAGVKLGLSDPVAIRVAYADLSQRLGPRVLIAPMIAAGVELAFGMIHDPQFGPIVMVSAGGILIEMLDDRRFALPPFDETKARSLIESLRVNRLLQGVRGKPPARLDLAARALAQFSTVVTSLRDSISEMDLNPIIVGPESCTVVDALIIPFSARHN